MADEPDRSKRQVKNPETFRERALKASVAAEQPAKTGLLRRFGSKLGVALSPVKRLLRKIFYRQPFKFIAKVIFPAYFRNSWRELKLVTWPNWQQSRRLTYAVLIFAVIFGASVALVDFGLDKLFKQVLLK